MSTKQITRVAMLSAVALVVFAIEAQIPSPVPISGVKLGLANVITLFAIWTLGRKQAAAILLVRIVLGSLVAGTVMTLMYSLAGGLLCLLVMALMKPLFSPRQIWIHSVFGAIAHNAGQITVAVLVMDTHGLFVAYGPVLLLSGIVTGLFTGFCAQAVVTRMNTLNLP